jgi:regulator of nucleoside diphosphate kinase
LLVIPRGWSTRPTPANRRGAIRRYDERAPLAIDATAAFVQTIRMTVANRRIVLTEQDMTRLRQLVEHHAGGKNAEEGAALEAELDRAEVVASTDVPPDVVTMNSRVRFCDADTGEEHEATLVYPADANIDAWRISVLAPVGAALLGLSIGQVIDWPLPSGATKRLRVVSVLYQPEAAGDFNR